jgi:SAM-dependent methyltransferase
VWLAAPLPPEELSAHYPPEYYGRQSGRFAGPGEAFEVWCRRLRARSIAGLRDGDSILDIGCGRGIMLAALRDRGWRTEGTELSDHAARHAREVLHLDVHVAEPASCEPGADPFDVVTLWHVLEHMPDARKCLEYVRQRIAPDGLLIVAVPNIDSLEARLGGRHWFHLDLPRHQCHFSARTLARLVESVGFAPVRMKRFSLEYGPYGMLQTLLNRMGFSHNLLYNALKAPQARLPWQGSPWSHRLQLGATLLLAPLLGPLAAALHLLDGLAFGGSCIELHAVPAAKTVAARPPVVE